MKLVTDVIIDKSIEDLDLLPDDFEKIVKELEEEQPVIAAYLVSETFDILNEEEKDFLIYLTLIIWKSVKKVNPQLLTVEEDRFGELEEENWETLEEAKGNSFTAKLDVFFENTEQEDLLAFIEDSLTDDEEDNIVTKEGRDALFIGLKTIMDALIEE